MQSDREQRSDREGHANGFRCLLVTRHVNELRPHPSYLRHCLTVSVDRLSAVARLGELAFRSPIVITRDRIVLDGYARWELARKQGLATLPCIEYELTEDEALRWLLSMHCRSNGLNDFCRILLALDREPDLREAARAHQQSGGQGKGSSKLTEAQRCDVRRQIASAAGVSVGNISKVREILIGGSPEVLLALKRGEIRIHRAWQWCRLTPLQQQAALRLYQSKRGVGKVIRNLIARHQPGSRPFAADKNDLSRLMVALESGKLDPVSVCVIDTPGRVIFVTQELLLSVGAQQELDLPCATNGH